MKVYIINDNGEREVIRCSKVEPSSLSRGRVIIDEGDRVINLDDIVAITD